MATEAELDIFTDFFQKLVDDIANRGGQQGE